MFEVLRVRGKIKVARALARGEVDAAVVFLGQLVDRDAVAFERAANVIQDIVRVSRRGVAGRKRRVAGLFAGEHALDETSLHRLDLVCVLPVSTVLISFRRHLRSLPLD